jgi:hypothetical protein
MDAQAGGVAVACGSLGRRGQRIQLNHSASSAPDAVCEGSVEDGFYTVAA